MLEEEESCQWLGSMRVLGQRSLGGLGGGGGGVGGELRRGEQRGAKIRDSR